MRNKSELAAALKKPLESLATIDFSNDGILRIIRNFDVNKTHGHEMISISLVKICADSIYKSLRLIFQFCIENRKFPSEWRSMNLILVHKNGISKH